MKFQVLIGALLCIECNVDVQRCNLVFVASGQQISGMIIEPIGSVAIQQSFVQFRISSMNSSGLTNVVNESSLKFVISQCKLAGSNLIQSASNGYIASAILAHISLNVTQFDICVDSTSRFGQNSVSVSMIGSETVKCDLCHDQSVVYGLCSEDLKFSENVNGMYQCPHPFEYVDNQCVCVTGYLLNNTKCIDVVEALNAIGNLIGSSSNNQIQLLEQKVDTIENSLILVDQSISSNISELENRILSNYSKSDNNLLINTSTLDNRIYQNISLVNNDILMKQIIADSNLFSNTTVLDWRIFYNVSNILDNMNNFTRYYNDSLYNLAQKIELQLITINNLTQQINCSSNAGYSMVNGSCVQVSCEISGQQRINGVCQCPIGQFVVNDTCKQENYEINISNFQCSQEVFNQSFDIQGITHQITVSGNFSAGYVFSSATVIQNAFIDISDNVYSTTVSPLFQSQSTFQNLKIQFGTQTFNSGSLLLSSSSVSINQMNIISRPGSQFTVNSAKLLNVLTSSSSTTNITNLLVNLSFAPSNGNITLINNINGVFNVSGYQVLGTYTSTGTVAMLGLNINTATVNVNEVNFKPTVFNVGNCSSYLLGNVATTSTLQIDNFAVILGSSSNFLLLGSISTTTSNQYRFGGIISYINSSSVVNINNVILDSYQQFSSDYVLGSGFLLGYIYSGSNITIQNVCLQQNATSTTLKFNYFGLIAWNTGNSSIQNISVAFAVQGAIVQSFGIIGYQYGATAYVEVVNVRTSVSVATSGSGNYVGSLFGFEAAQNCSVLNVSVAEGNISSGATNQVGGFIGRQNSGQLYLKDSKIQSVHLSGGSNVGIVVGLGSGTINIISSSSAQIYVNGALRDDCTALSNWDGC
ncbi:Growth_factor receptor cysteine-rich domain superfamily [Hexamita inflata]|uniref:Growth factor receptor cysteine-rich domain superfamily n=1 Tax=Hexamita inflata TaxID=28002 RepID=A0AA86QFF6_9EUKA|nr:Growth factor receptor cysteine-rich domain superfamily [Hexamita inflata]